MDLSSRQLPERVPVDVNICNLIQRNPQKRNRQAVASGAGSTRKRDLVLTERIFPARRSISLAINRSA